jgi:hypothetical protein
VIWLWAILAILSLYLLVGYAILVWSEPSPDEPEDALNFIVQVKVLLGWPFLLVALFTRGCR